MIIDIYFIERIRNQGKNFFRKNSTTVLPRAAYSTCLTDKCQSILLEHFIITGFNFTSLYKWLIYITCTRWENIDPYLSDISKISDPICIILSISNWSIDPILLINILIYLYIYLPIKSATKIHKPVFIRNSRNGRFQFPGLSKLKIMEWFHFAYKSSLSPPLWQDVEGVPREKGWKQFYESCWSPSSLFSRYRIGNARVMRFNKFPGKKTNDKSGDQL